SRCSSCSPPPLFFLTCPPPPASTLFPYTTLFRSGGARSIRSQYYPATASSAPFFIVYLTIDTQEAMGANMMNTMLEALKAHILGDRKSTRLNSSHVSTSYAVFCSKKKPER